GFDGPAERGLMELELAGQRKGALKLLSSKPFKLTDMPPVAPDALSWTMTNFDLKVIYDEGINTARTILQTVSPDELPKLDALLKEADEGLGINIRKDLLESLGDQLVSYSSLSEGTLFFGQTYLVKVKDEKKLLEALDLGIKGLGKRTGLDITTKKR